MVQPKVRFVNIQPMQRRERVGTMLVWEISSYKDSLQEQSKVVDYNARVIIETGDVHETQRFVRGQNDK